MSTLLEVLELRRVRVEAKVLPLLRWCARAQLVEDVVVALRKRLIDDAGTLKKVCPYPGADNFLLTVKQDLIASQQADVR